MPKYYLSKPKCCECNREFSGLLVGSGEENQPFVFRLHANMTPENILSKYIELLADPELQLIDQWLRVQNKDEFVINIDINKNKSCFFQYYEHESIHQNSLGYLYSTRDLNLR